MEKKDDELTATIEMLERKLEHQQIQLSRMEREARVEAALEVVRSRTLAMYESNELGEMVEVLFQQLKVLGINAISGWISLVNVEKSTLEFWIKHSDKPVVPIVVDATTRENFKKEIDDWVKGKEYIEMPFPAKDAVNALKNLFNIDLIEVENEHTFHLLHVRHQHGYLGFGAWQQAGEENRIILKRFARVFDQTYTRFLDLQKAEALARESQIEAALERIRSRAMAMHGSDEFGEVVGMLFEQLQQIGFDLKRCFIILINDRTHELAWWSGSFMPVSPPDCYVMPSQVLESHPLGQAFFMDWMNGTPYRTARLSGERKRSWDQLLFTDTELKHIHPEIKNDLIALESVFLCDAFIPHGTLEVVGNEPLTKENAEILQRFAKVIDLTSTRIEDLLQAESRARAAIQQASLDRVRGEIASMRSAEDLQRITPLVWHELTSLGVPFFRCGVFIVSENKTCVHAYLSTPDGHPLGVLNIPFGSNDITDDMVVHWRQDIVYKDHWDKDQFIKWMQSMIEQGRLHSAEEYQGNTAPPESLYLNFIPFTQGMLYVGNSAELTPEEIQQVQTLAKAFSIAYARYEDFKQMEEAKEQIEKTLTELKATQSQLIQSEKMASLGELTAGVAHEIQNPLNFVNNISEINRELVTELVEEIKTGNLEEALQIASDLERNEGKILEHGKRADAIVKSMLQHSQRSSGTRAPTNLNALADEYLRLAYHGLKGKDKKFESGFETDFDTNLPKINVIPQEMGRVLLNIINNAFQAVNEKRQKGLVGYQPAVSVCTRQVNGTVEVCVRDNGKGIPEAIRDKIFQPFFTTKPAGQGTGLGLSLAYDIVIAHGGKLKLETEVGVGTEFIVQLPL